MIYAKLVLMPSAPQIQGATPEIKMSFRFSGKKQAMKFWKNEIESLMPEIKSVPEMITWADQFFAENEFIPGPTTQFERYWFLPSKDFFLKPKK